MPPRLAIKNQTARLTLASRLEWMARAANRRDCATLELVLGLSQVTACAGSHANPPATVVAKPIPVAPPSTMIVPVPVPAPVPAPAPVSPLPYTIVPVPLPLKIAPIIISIDGTKPDDVWLLAVERPTVGYNLATSHLFHSDGKHTRLIQRDLCVENLKAPFQPYFTRVRTSKGDVEIDGVTAGANQLFLNPARRSSNGTLKCHLPSTPSGHSVDFIWSAGDPLTLTSGMVWYVSWAHDGANIPGLAATVLAGVVAAMPHGAHAWVVLSDTADNTVRLAEWTGMRWRERPDSLPSGVSPIDIVALSATAGGAYFGVTRKQLLTYDGENFQGSPVPEGFEPERFYASDKQGLWVFAPNRVWRFYRGVWEGIAIPLLHTNAYWLAPNGEVWISGSNVQSWSDVVGPGTSTSDNPNALDLERAAARVIRLVPHQELERDR